MMRFSSVSSCRAWLALVVLALLTLSSCTLRPYVDGEVSCSRADGAAPCPAGFACLPRSGKNVCIEIGCGDGEVDLESDEQCDDGNDNRLDTCVDCVQKKWIATPAVGFGTGDGEPSITPIGRPSVVASDRRGTIYIGSIGTNVITRLDGAGKKLSTFAGNGSLVSAETATAAAPNEVTTVFAASLAVDGIGNVFFSDLQNSVIRRIDAVTGDSTIIAGTGVQGVGAENVPATQTNLDLAVGLALDGDGNLFIAEKHSGAPGQLNRIRRLDRRTGVITTVIAKKGDHFDPALDTELDGPPDDIAFAPDGRLIVFTNGFDIARTPLVPVVDTAGGYTAEATVAYTVTTLTLDGAGRLVGKVKRDIPVRVDRLTFKTELGADGIFNDGAPGSDDVIVEDGRLQDIVTLSTCVTPDRAQERITVAADSGSLYHPAGRQLLQLDLDFTDPATACRILAEVPGAPDADATTFGVVPAEQEPASDGALILVPSDVAVDVDGQILFADPGNGVVWRFAPDQSNQPLGAHIGERSEISPRRRSLRCARPRSRPRIRQAHRWSPRRRPHRRVQRRRRRRSHRQRPH